MNDYEQKVLVLDKELAELLGWSDIEIVDYSPDSETYSPDGILMGTNPKGFSLLYIPRLTQEDAAVFQLAVKYNIDIGPEIQSDYWDGTGGDSARMQYEFDSVSHKMQNIRKIIVESVIHKLKGNV